LEDETYARWSITLWNKDNVREMQKAVHPDYNKKEETIKEKIRILVDSCYNILSKNLRMHHICQHITSRILSIHKGLHMP
jgi:hypothetical protein